MQIVDQISSLRAVVQAWRKSFEPIALVPTMGNLHAGHLKLVDVAAQYATRIVVTIFVNPTQFSHGEDFESYPRTLQDDIHLLEEKPVDLLFCPGTREVYPESPHTSVTVAGLSDLLCGEYRPGHFSGVATVVAKLFNMVQPDVAIFGEKDFQQLAIIRKMGSDLNFPVRIESAPTVREDDGLALSSRNRYLTPDERRIAPLLYQEILLAERKLLNGDDDFSKLEHHAKVELSGNGFRPDYFSVRRIYDLQPASRGDRELVILAAAWLGKARLIDNRVVRLDHAASQR